jgi:FtsP/CotA-like multicopper oxidase with cupredoxin domain
MVNLGNRKIRGRKAKMKPILRDGSRLLRLLAVLSCVVAANAHAFPNGQAPFPGARIPQFTQPLPLLSAQPGGTINTIVAPFAQPLDLTICEFKANILPPGFVPANGQPYTGTWVWGYIPGTTCPTTPQDTYLGPVLVNLRGTPTTIRFTNALPTVDLTNVLAYKFSTDQTLHWADPNKDPLLNEVNMCHMNSGDPPAVGVGIPNFASFCSLNFGEGPRGSFNAVGIPATPHLHGGEVPPAIDGGPDSWFTSDGLAQGHDYYTNPNVQLTGANQAAYSYPNTQGAAPIWFHDHTLGATRLNVYAGIAGGYYIVDPAEAQHLASIRMRPVGEVIPLILQDRQFDTNGQLYFPANFPGGLNGPSTNPEHPYWIPEFLGDTIVINGKAWPFLSVEPRRYRFLFLNGSNARTYEMFLVNSTTKVMGPVMWAIGNDGGFLDFPSIIDPNAAKPVEPHLIIMPGERYEVIIDFSSVAGQTLVLKNVAKAPYPGGTAPQGSTTGQLMQFRVSATPVADASYDPVSGIALRPTALVRVASNGAVPVGVPVAAVRELTLNEVALAPQTVPQDPVTGLTTAYPGGPVEILVNNTSFSGKPRSDFSAVTVNGRTEYVSETPKEGSTEIWEIVNTTMDAHPIHTHLATFQILNRQKYDTKRFPVAYAAAFPGDGSTACPKGVYCPAFGPPLPYETGLKRTVNSVQVPLLGGNPDITPFLANAASLPDPDEVGWKDTVLTLPGMVTRFVIRFAPTDTPAGTIAGYPFSPNDSPTGSVSDSHGYVWHCHIIDHEDNEMMRPDVIVPLVNATRTYVKSVDY